MNRVEHKNNVMRALQVTTNNLTVHMHSQMQKPGDQTAPQNLFFFTSERKYIEIQWYKTFCGTVLDFFISWKRHGLQTFACYCTYRYHGNQTAMLAAIFVGNGATLNKM